MTNAPVAGGYILLARKLFESEMMNKPPLYFKLWGWMLARAMWKDGDKLKRGQFVTSISEMQQAMSYRVGWRREVPTRDEIRSAYETFTKTLMITTTKTTRGMVITILNYDTYQNAQSYEAHKEAPRKPTATPHDRKEREEGRRKFSIPTLDEVRAYCLERDKGVDPEKWMNHYTAKGWKIGSAPMKDWKAAVRTWERSPSFNGGAVVDLGHVR